MFRLRLEVGDGDLVRAESSLDGEPIDRFRSGPTLRRTEHDHRPAGMCAWATCASFALDARDLFEAGVEGGRQSLVHRLRFISSHIQGRVPVALEQAGQLLFGYARQHRRVGDLVSV